MRVDLLPVQGTDGSIGARMPTVLRAGPFRFYFFSHESTEPPHIHVDRKRLSAKFGLNPVQLARNMGFATHELRQIERLILNDQVKLLEAWDEYHGNER